MHSSPLVNAVRSSARRLIYLALAANVSFIALTAFRGRPVWWIRFMGEHNMWTRGTALELLASSGVCALIYSLCHFQAANGRMPVLRPYLWLVMSVGFAYLAMDELFMIHENTERLLHVSDAFAVLAYMLVALALGRLLLADLRKAPRALAFFALAIVCTAMSLAIDAVTHVRGPMMAYEEIFEIFGVYFFLASFISALTATTCQVLADAIHASA